MIRKALVIILGIIGYGLACSQEVDSAAVRPILSSYMIDFGAAHMADTYLSPLHYHGQRIGLAYERAQAMSFCPQRWLMQLDLGAEFEITENPARNATMAAFSLNASWRMLHKWQLPKNIIAGVGPANSLSIGGIYLSRNGNNPASVKAAFTFDAAAFASWRTRMWRVPVTVRYQATLPFAGAFFSPNYGQLYYQIYMGDTQRLAHMAWWGSYFRLDNLLSADLNLGKVSLRVGYRCNILSTKASHIVTRDISHCLVLGISTESIYLSRGKLPTSTRIANAY